MQAAKPSKKMAGLLERFSTTIIPKKRGLDLPAGYFLGGTLGFLSFPSQKYPLTYPNQADGFTSMLLGHPMQGSLYCHYVSGKSLKLIPYICIVWSPRKWVYNLFMIPAMPRVIFFSIARGKVIQNKNPTQNVATIFPNIYGIWLSSKLTWWNWFCKIELEGLIFFEA